MSAGSVVWRAKRESFFVVGALAGALTGSDVMDFGGGVHAEVYFADNTTYLNEILEILLI